MHIFTDVYKHSLSLNLVNARYWLPIGYQFDGFGTKQFQNAHFPAKTTIKPWSKVIMPDRRRYEVREGALTMLVVGVSIKSHQFGHIQDGRSHDGCRTIRFRCLWPVFVRG
jgi:hypothetical protein